MSIWQTKSWWKFLISSGQAEEIFEVSDIRIEKRQVSLWEYWLFALWVDVKNISDKIFKKLEDLCKQQDCLFIQLETLDYNLAPPLPLGEEIQRWGLWEIVWGNWKKGYYKKFITPYTAVIDLEKSEDDILAAMKPKGRYNIKLARKKWVEVTLSKNSNTDIESFYSLMQETTSRDSFVGNSLDYYKKFLSENKNSKLLLAKKDRLVITAGIFIFDEDVSIYYYGASTSDKQYRNLMAPYLLQWEAVLLAKSHWSKLYDFLWVAAPDEQNSELSGVTSFKKKLTPDIRKVSESYIYINKKWKYRLIQILRNLKK